MVQLKDLLRERSCPTSGTKVQLIQKLTDVLMEEGLDPDTFVMEELARVEKQKEAKEDDVKPSDSVSNITKRSETSSVRSERVRESAKRLALETRQKMLEEKQRLERESILVRQRQEALKLQTEIAEVQARENVLVANEEKESGTSRHSIKPQKNLEKGVEDENDNVELAAPNDAITSFDGRARANFGSSDELMKQLVTFNMKSLMPKNEIKKFSGDYTQFNSFIKAFDCVISNKLISDEEKLYYLSQYTEGKPLDIVKSCMHMSGGTGYKEAREILDKRYGNYDKIVNTYVEKLLKWPNIRYDEAEKLDEFSIFLINCKNAISRVKGYSEVDHPKTLREIIGKLPYSTQDKWTRRVDSIMEAGKERVQFHHLVSFVEDEARIANNPSFGRKFFQSRQRDERGNSSRGAVACNTLENISSQIRCWHCGNNHFLDKCQTLRSLEYQQRMNVLRDLRVCFNV